MKEYKLESCALRAERPVEVGRGAGHFWFSTLHRFNDNDLICEVVLSADKQQGEWPAVLYLSRDGGASWKKALEIVCYGPASTLVSEHKLLLMPYEQWPEAPGDRRNAGAEGTLVTLNDDGSISAGRPRVAFMDLPADLAPLGEDELCLLSHGNVLALGDGHLFTTCYGKFAGEEKYCNMAFTSEDGGYTWQYLSLVADASTIPTAREGPNESSDVILADGRIMSVYRVGGGADHLYHRSTSADGGKSWTAPEPIEGARSVEPKLARLDNGLLLLSGGRPGILLWVAADAEGTVWERMNLAQHHNATVPDESLHYCDAVAGGEGRAAPAQTTSYTGMVRVGANEVLITYDRLGNGWGEAPGPWGDASTVFTVRVRAEC